ncbi:MAG: hypothetical protein ABEJ76_08870 [Halanaeroarchaeum sp.]
MTSTTVTVRLDDEEDADLVERLEREDVKSDAVRAALRSRYDLTSGHDLPDTLAKVYDALLTITDGGGRVRLSVVKKAVPQFVTQYDKGTVVDAALRPLEAAGYVTPIQRVETVWLYVRPEIALEDADGGLDHGGSDQDSHRSLSADERDEAILNGDYDTEGSA